MDAKKRKIRKITKVSSRQGTFDEVELVEVKPVDEPPKAKLFRVGRTILVSMGVSEKQSGSIIGRWLKINADPIGILAALQYAADQCVVEPISYVTALLTETKRGKITLADEAKRLAEQARELERRPPATE